MKIEVTHEEMKSLREGIVCESLAKRILPEPDVYCGVCGYDTCDDIMAHVEDEELMHEIMGFAMGHPDGFCRKCGSSQTIYEMDTDGYPCDDPDCEGLLLHPAQHLGIM